MKNIGIITQARTGSSRLPNKIFLKAKGISLIEYHLKRLSWSGITTYIATTLDPKDIIIEEFCKRENINYWRGEENNVLSRFYECAKANQLETIIRVTSDCPLIDGLIIKNALEIYLNENNPDLYFSNTIDRTFPRGLDFEIFSFTLLEQAYLQAESNFDKEHVTPFIWNNRSGNVVLKQYKNKTNNSELRITVDTQDDFLLIQKLIEDHKADELIANEIIDILRDNPELVAINKDVQQKST